MVDQSNDDDEDLDVYSSSSSLSSEDDVRNKDGLTKENLPFQKTDGGAIMPEDGANPCVIKVS